MKNGTIFLQPHSDDMVMSSFFLMTSGFFEGPRFLVTVFSKSTWMDPKKRSFYGNPKDPEQVTRLRTQEDKRFAKVFGLKHISLGFEDCLLRTGKTYFHPRRHIEEGLVSAVTQSIVRLVRKHRIKTIVAPFPSGRRQHHDHRTVCRAAVNVAGLTNLFFVDDLPYGNVCDLRRNNLRIAQRVKGALSQKIDAMKIYDSQMCDLFFANVRHMTRNNEGHERLMMFTNRE